MNKLSDLSSKIGDRVFSRKDLVKVLGISSTAAGKLISKMKDADLITGVSNMGKGKYIFINIQNSTHANDH